MSSGISWRISLSLQDRSQRSNTIVETGIGATVVASSKSVEEPILFARGETVRMLNMFGVPTSASQGLLEAIEYNKYYPLWCLSPAVKQKRGYLEVTPAGVTAGDGYITSNPESAVFEVGKDFESVKDSSSGIVTTKVYVPIQNFATTTNVYAVILKAESKSSDDAVEINIPNLNIDDAELRVFSDMDNKLSGSWDLVKDVSTSALLGFTLILNSIDVTYNLPSVYWTKNYSTSNVVAILIQKSVGKFNFTFNLTAKQVSPTPYFECNILGIPYTGKGVTTLSNVSFALDPSAVDGFENSLNIESVFEDNDYFRAMYTGYNEYNITASGSLDPVKLVGFERDNTQKDVDFTKAYDYFKSAKKYPVDIFFDATGNSLIPSMLSELRGVDSGSGETLGSQPFARILLPLNSTKADDIKNEVNNIPKGRGICAFAGKMKIRNAYSTAYKVFEGVPMGDIAIRYADSWVLAYGGLAVAWIDENGVGGQLKSGRCFAAASSQPEFNETTLRELDEARCNMVVYDDTYGPMILSRRTTHSDYSDYSFSDYSMIVDYVAKNIIKHVLPYQIVKMNDSAHRSIVYARAEAILKPMTVKPYNVLRNYAILCNEENNNDEVLAKEEFRLDVALQVTPKSRTIHLSIINTPQTSTVEAMFE